MSVSSYLNTSLWGLHHLSIAYQLELPDSGFFQQLPENIANLAPSEELGYFLGEGIENTEQPGSVKLTSIFSSLGENTNPKEIPQQAVRIHPDFFSFRNLDTNEVNLQKERLEELLFALAEVNNKANFASSALRILEQYGSTTPLLRTHAHIPIYDLVKLTAALQCCQSKNTDSVLLVGGGFSGIQDYIYTIISKNASKSLKGRSFYLQLLADAIIRRLLAVSGLNDFHLVYASGGGFLILAPNTAECKSKLRKDVKKINSLLFQEHQSRILLTLEPRELLLNELSGRAFSRTIAHIQRQLEKQKRQRHLDAILEDTKFFEKLGYAGIWERDAITGQELIAENGSQPTKRYPLFRYEDETQTIQYVNPITYQQIQLGRQLQELAAIAVTDVQKSLNTFHLEPGRLGFRYHIFPEDKFSFPLDTKLEWAIFNQGRDLSGVELITADRGYYAGFQTPFSQDQEGRDVPMSFNEFAGKGDFKRLGVLRMDVDDLGLRFETEVNNLLDYSVLSRYLDYFFQGYVNALWNEEHKSEEERVGYNTCSTIIYSGGDDLFIVGRWNAALGLAHEIQSAFATWTAPSKLFRISGGLVIIPPKYPVMRGAVMAAEALDISKDHKLGTAHKNSFTLFGHALNWQGEFPVVQKLKNQILGFIQQTGNRSLFQRIASYLQLAEEAGDGKWRWVISYDLYRLRDRIPRHKGHLKKQIEEWVEACTSNQVRLDGKTYRFQPGSGSNYSLIQLFALAARLAELEYRTKKIQYEGSTTMAKEK